MLLRYLLMYVSEGCQPANRVYYVDLAALSERKPDGSVDWRAYDFNTGQWC
jgi:prolyl oligopeptidase